MTVHFGDYGDRPRTEMLEFVPNAAQRVLEVGCLGGGFGAALKAARPGTVVSGIEPNPEAAEFARSRLDQVICGTFPADVDETMIFDCIVFNDVLEHMVDPWAALVAARQALAPGGYVVASIPNVRHFSVVVPFVMYGQWRYTGFGILDQTHVRFLAGRVQIHDLFGSTGYSVERCERIRVTRAIAVWPRLLHLAGRWGSDFLNENFAVAARPGSPPASLGPMSHGTA